MENLKRKEFLLPIRAEKKEEFYNEIKRITENGKSIKGEWNGDYLVNTYIIDGKTVEIWTNMELGIYHSIKYID